MTIKHNSIGIADLGVVHNKIIVNIFSIVQKILIIRPPPPPPT